MIYVVQQNVPQLRNVTIDSFLNGNKIYRCKTSNTTTRMKRKVMLDREKRSLALEFATNLEALKHEYENVPRDWHSFKIPKKTGGMRDIDAPCDELKNVQWKILEQFDKYFPYMHHTSAYAYIKNRNTLKCLKKHVKHESKYYMKTDFSDFFGSFTKEDITRLISKVSPFALISGTYAQEGWRWMLDIATKDGRLVQGSPLSPTLTNIMMIPFDHEMCNRLKKENIIYTRYCDDIIMSSKKKIDTAKVLHIINQAIDNNGMPLRIKPEKTRVGSVHGRNWNLGLMINGYNQITVGHEQKKVMKACLHRAIMKVKAGERLEKEEAQHLFGVLNYYRSVEKDYFQYVLDWFQRKYGIDIYNELKNY